MHAAHEENAQVIASSHHHDKALPSMRMITVLSRFQVVMNTIKDITMLLGLYGEWVPSPSQMLEGNLFALLCAPSKLDEEELEEVIMERLQTALDTNLIRFSANRDEAISILYTNDKRLF